MLEMFARNWWALALRGVAAVAFGVMALVWPAIVAEVLVVLFGLYVTIDGILTIIAALRDRASHRRWWVVLLQGLAGVVFGLVAYGWPRPTALVLLLFIAAWAIVTGIFEIFAAIVLRQELKGEWMLALSGVLSIALGTILAVQPSAGSVALVWLIGVYAILLGLILVVLAFRVRRVHREMQGLADAVE